MLTSMPGLTSADVIVIMSWWKCGWKRYRLPSTATVSFDLPMRFTRTAMPALQIKT